jgi:hypothetical protein
MTEYLTLVVPEMGCAYRWSKEFNQLEWCPMFADGNIETSNWGVVEKDLVGEEQVMFRGMEVTLSQVYRVVEKLLKGDV